MSDPHVIKYEFLVPETGYVLYDYVLDSMDIDTVVEEWGDQFNDKKGTNYDLDTLYEYVGDIIDLFYDAIKDYFEDYAKERWLY